MTVPHYIAPVPDGLSPLIEALAEAAQKADLELVENGVKLDITITPIGIRYVAECGMHRASIYLGWRELDLAINPKTMLESTHRKCMEELAK